VSDAANAVFREQGESVANRSFLNPLVLLRRGAGSFVNVVVDFVGDKFGLGRTNAKIIVAVGLLIASPAALGYFLMSFGGMFRKVLMFKENRRFGSVSDLEAIEKEEEIVEADEDEDDDDDDDGGDDGSEFE